MSDRLFGILDAPEPDHQLLDDDANIHYTWNNATDPIRTVEPGEVVRFDCRDALDGQLGPDSTVEEYRTIETKGHALTGPVAVDGAEPGDTLRVDLLEFEHEGWGFSAVPEGDSGGGLLPEEFPDPHFRVWDLDTREDGTRVARFADEDAPEVAVPIHPFPGNLGVVPSTNGDHDTMPPRNVGGNMDVKHLTAGSTLYLPIEAAGGLFSMGDCHAAQGDGEVCITGIEAPMSVTVRLDVAEDHSVDQPEFETTGPFTPTGGDEPMYATTGIAPDLMVATKDAVRNMINHLHDYRGFSRADAYVLCSAAVDLKISEVVDAPNWTVTAYLPESILVD